MLTKCLVILNLTQPQTKAVKDDPTLTDQPLNIVSSNGLQDLCEMDLGIQVPLI